METAVVSEGFQIEPFLVICYFLQLYKPLQIYGTLQITQGWGGALREHSLRSAVLKELDFWS